MNEFDRSKDEEEKGMEISENDRVSEVVRASKSLDELIVDIEQIISAEDKNLGQKLYNYCHDRVSYLTRRQLRALFDRKQNISVNGEYVGSDGEYKRLKEGDLIKFAVSARDFILHSPEYSDVRILHQDESICLIEKLSNVNCAKDSLFEFAFRLKCWDGLHYQTCQCLYRVPKHGSGIMIIAKDTKVLRCLLASFKQSPNYNYLEMYCVTSSSKYPSREFEASDPARSFDVIDGLRIRTIQTVCSREYGFVSLQSVTPIFRLKDEEVSEEEQLKQRELLSIDLKRIKHALQRNDIAIIGLDYVGKQGKGVYASWSNVSVTSPSRSTNDETISVELPLPGKFKKFIEKQEYFKDRQRQKLGDTVIDNDNEESIPRPVEYQRGFAEFCGLQFIVNENVMIPRISSKPLIDCAIELIQKKINDASFQRGEILSILDLGTGSGSLLLTIVHSCKHQWEFLKIRGKGIDLSQEALGVATENQEKLQLDKEVELSIGSFSEWKSWKPLGDVGFDIIVCNPPYSSLHEKRRLSMTSKLYEPSLALYADTSDPLRAYRQLASTILEIEELESQIKSTIFKDEVYFIIEIGAGQLESVLKIFQQVVNLGTWKYHTVKEDHNNFERALILRRLV